MGLQSASWYKIWVIFGRASEYLLKHLQVSECLGRKLIFTKLGDYSRGTYFCVILFLSTKNGYLITLSFYFNFTLVCKFPWFYTVLSSLEEAT